MKFEGVDEEVQVLLLDNRRLSCHKVLLLFMHTLNSNEYWGQPNWIRPRMGQNDLVCECIIRLQRSLLGLLAKIKLLGVLPAHLPLVLDAGTVLVSVQPLSCAGFVCCHCTGRWAVLDNSHGKDSGVFRLGLLYSHYHGPYFYLVDF